MNVPIISIDVNPCSESHIKEINTIRKFHFILSKFYVTTYWSKNISERKIKVPLVDPILN